MERLRAIAKKRFGGETGYKLLHFMSRNPIAAFFIGVFYGNDLTKLAVINNTDKYRTGRHQYTRNYQDHFGRIRHKRLNLLEIGVGGYERPDRGGCSLRMWKRYFPKGRIYAIDIYDKSPQEEYRIKIFKGSQADHAFLGEVVAAIQGGPDIVIDDGSHINSHVITSFKYLFPRLNARGIYVVEDVQTSYRDDYGGDSGDLGNPNTIMNYFKGISDLVNQSEFDSERLSNEPFSKEVLSIHFYHNLIFIHKK